WTSVERQDRGDTRIYNRQMESTVLSSPALVNFAISSSLIIPPTVTTHRPVSPWSLEVICHSHYLNPESIGAQSEKVL
ncbi:hypothetical protein DV515_00011859, partial [Chloebia gouldiae]